MRLLRQKIIWGGSTLEELWEGDNCLPKFKLFYPSELSWINPILILHMNLSLCPNISSSCYRSKLALHPYYKTWTMPLINQRAHLLRSVMLCFKTNLYNVFGIQVTQLHKYRLPICTKWEPPILDKDPIVESWKVKISNNLGLISKLSSPGWLN